jgi:hypothetical protein
MTTAEYIQMLDEVYRTVTDDEVPLTESYIECLANGFHMAHSHWTLARFSHQMDIPTSLLKIATALFPRAK